MLHVLSELLQVGVLALKLGDLLVFCLNGLVQLEHTSTTTIYTPHVHHGVHLLPLAYLMGSYDGAYTEMLDVKCKTGFIKLLISD